MQLPIDFRILGMSPYSGMTWGHTYEGPKKKRRYISDATRAYRARRSRGATVARGDASYTRVTTILSALDEGPLESSHLKGWAKQWDISVARVEQLIAEARRTRKRMKRLHKS